MNNPDPLKIGLLLCDDVDASAQPQYGTYTRMFQHSIDPSAQRIHLQPVRCFAGEALPEPAEFDGYLITGSRYSVYQGLPWIGLLQHFIRQCWEQHVKIVGICFGHQLIAHALGGKTQPAAAGWGFGIHSAKITDKQPWMTDIGELDGDIYNLVVIHQDQVVDVPAQFKSIATSDFCPNSMIVAPDKMLGIQGHPEFSKEFCAFRAQCRKDVIGPETYRATLRSLAENETHSSTILRWVDNFLHQ